MGGFKDYEPAALRIPVRGPFGQLVASTFGEIRDDELALLRVALLSRLPSRCPADALTLLGRTFNIERYEADTDDSYRARLEDAFATWAKAGSPGGIEDQIRAFGVPDVLVLMNFDGNFWPPGAWYSRFRVQLGPSLGILTFTNFIIGEGIIGQTPIGGPHLAAAQRRTLKAIILKWKSAHSYPVDIFIRITGDIIGQDCVIGSSVIGGTFEQIWIGRLIGKNIVIGSTPIGGYDLS